MHRKMIQRLLHFVQRGRILFRCGSAFALSLPSLGVSSLDLGRLFTQAALFSCLRDSGSLVSLAPRNDGAKRSRDSGLSPEGCPGMTDEIDLYSAAAWNGPRSPSGTAASAS